MDNTIKTISRSNDEHRELHVNAIKRINRDIPEHLQHHFSDLELYHLTCLHNRWFPKSRKEKQR